MVAITFDEYDRIEEINAQIDEETRTNELGNYKQIFCNRLNYPTVEEMEAHEVKDHLDLYLPYILYYYTNPLDNEDKAYKNSMAYIQMLLKTTLTLVDTEEEVAEIMGEALC